MSTMPPSACRSTPSLISWGRTPAMIEWLASRTRQAVSLPPEAPAEVRQVHLDVVERNARGRCSSRVRRFGVLRRRPNLDTVAFHQRGAVHRLQRSMVEKRRVVLRLDHLGRGGESRLDVAVVARDRNTGIL